LYDFFDDDDTYFVDWIKEHDEEWISRQIEILQRQRNILQIKARFNAKCDRERAVDEIEKNPHSSILKAKAEAQHLSVSTEPFNFRDWIENHDEQWFTETSLYLDNLQTKAEAYKRKMDEAAIVKMKLKNKVKAQQEQAKQLQILREKKAAAERKAKAEEAGSRPVEK